MQPKFICQHTGVCLSRSDSEADLRRAVLIQPGTKASCRETPASDNQSSAQAKQNQLFLRREWVISQDTLQSY